LICELINIIAWIHKSIQDYFSKISLLNFLYLRDIYFRNFYFVDKLRTAQRTAYLERTMLNAIWVTASSPKSDTKCISQIHTLTETPTHTGPTCRCRRLCERKTLAESSRRAAPSRSHSMPDGRGNRLTCNHNVPHVYLPTATTMFDNMNNQRRKIRRTVWEQQQ